MATTSTSFKIQFQGELRRLSPPPAASAADEDSWVSLEQRISQLISLPVGSFTVKYTDEDGDLITLSTNGELTDLINSSKSAKSAKSATSIRLQVFPKSPAPVAAAVATPEIVSRTSTAQEQQENNNEDDDDDDDEDGDEDSDDATSTASSEEKGKEKIDETQQPESTVPQEEKPQDQQQQQQQQEQEQKQQEQEQEQQQQPSLKDVFEKATQLGEKIQGIFEQHPEIGEEIESIRELFATVIVNQFKEQQRQQEELRQRHHDFLASRLRAFGFHPHPHCRPAATTASTSNQQQQQQQQEPPRAGCSRQQQQQQQQGTGSYHCGPRRCGGQGAPAVHPFARVFEEKLSILENMGFVDRELNVFLLRKYQGSIEAIVQALSEDL